MVFHHNFHHILSRIPVNDATAVGKVSDSWRGRWTGRWDGGPVDPAGAALRGRWRDPEGQEKVPRPVSCGLVENCRFLQVVHSFQDFSSWKVKCEVHETTFSYSWLLPAMSSVADRGLWNERRIIFKRCMC